MQLDLVSKYKSEIYGISIFWIMLFHAIAILDMDYSHRIPQLWWLQHIISCGNVGVDVFLFCSGIAMYFSFVRNSNLMDYLNKRLTRLFLPLFIIDGSYWIFTELVQGFHPEKFALKVSLLRFWTRDDQQVWFASTILVFYLLYPYIYNILFHKEGKEWLYLCLLLVLTVIITWSMKVDAVDTYERVEIGLTRLPVFLLGCYAGKLVYVKAEVPKWVWGILFFCAILFFFVLYRGYIHSIWRRWFYIVGGISFTYIFCLLLKPFKKDGILRRFFRFLGSCSLELYYAHIMVIRLYKMTPYYENSRLLHYVPILILSILIAFATLKICDFGKKALKSA